jgi:thiamine biosynthesis lipoprotein
LNLVRHPFTAMGGPCELQLYADSPALAQAAFAAGEAEVRRLEARYSRYRDDSVVTRINRGAGGDPVEVDDETARLLDYADTAFHQSDGAFDLTTGALRRAWDFKARRVPAQAALDAVQRHVGWDKLRWQRPRLTLPEGMELDLGGVVKEYAADCAARALAGAGIVRGLVELGGDIAIVGPHPDGSAWQVGIRHPRDPETAIATVELARGAIASSGDYERFFEAAGRRYCHILDPRTGWPVQGLSAVSVIAPQCLVAGTATTIAMLKGPAQGPRWLAELGLPHLYVDASGAIGGTLSANPVKRALQTPPQPHP